MSMGEFFFRFFVTNNIFQIETDLFSVWQFSPIPYIKHCQTSVYNDEKPFLYNALKFMRMAR
jgi:hypothetical protein